MLPQSVCVGIVLFAAVAAIGFECMSAHLVHRNTLADEDVGCISQTIKLTVDLRHKRKKQTASAIRATSVACGWRVVGRGDAPHPPRATVFGCIFVLAQTIVFRPSFVGFCFAVRTKAHLLILRRGGVTTRKSISQSFVSTFFFDLLCFLFERRICFGLNLFFCSV